MNKTERRRKRSELLAVAARIYAGPYPATPDECVRQALEVIEAVDVHMDKISGVTPVPTLDDAVAQVKSDPEVP